MCIFQAAKKIDWNLVVVTFLLAPLLIACTATSEVSITPTAMINGVNEEIEPTQFKPAAIATTLSSTQEPQPTAQQPATATLEPTKVPTPEPSIIVPEEIEGNSLLQQYYDKYVDFFIRDEGSGTNVVLSPEAIIQFHVFNTAQRQVLIAEIADGSMSISGQVYGIGTIVRFFSLSAREPLFASLPQAQAIVDAAGLDESVIAISVDLNNARTIAISEDRTVAYIDKDGLWQAIELQVFNQGTLLTDDTDLSDPEHSEEVLTFFLPRTGSGTAWEQIGYFDEVPEEFQEYYNNLISAAEFRAQMETECGLDVPLASSTIDELPAETTLYYNCARVLGIQTWQYEEFTEDFLVLQTFGGDQDKVIPIIYLAYVENPHTEFKFWDPKEQRMLGSAGTKTPRSFEPGQMLVLQLNDRDIGGTQDDIFRPLVRPDSTSSQLSTGDEGMGSMEVGYDVGIPQP